MNALKAYVLAHPDRVTLALAGAFLGGIFLDIIFFVDVIRLLSILYIICNSYVIYVLAESRNRPGLQWVLLGLILPIFIPLILVRIKTMPASNN